MANNEKSFADRVGRAELLNQTVAGFPTPFTPGDPDLLPPTFTTFITGVITKNNDVETQRATYSVQSGNRVKKVEDIKKVSIRARDYVHSVIAFDSYFTTVKRLVKVIKGYRTPKRPPDPNQPQPNPKKRNQGEQSFADIANNFKALISNLSSIVPPYAPSSPELQLASLTTISNDLDGMNENMGTLFGDLSVTVGERLSLYDGTNGLRDKMLAIKAAVKSQYGSTSPEYLSVKGISP